MNISPSPKKNKKTKKKDPGDVLHASVDASWRSCWARHSDVPTFTKCIQLGLHVSRLIHFYRPPCSRTTCLLDKAWPGNLASQGAVPVACFLHVHLQGQLAFFLPYTVTHMCHDMTGLAIMAGRLGAKTFSLPLAGIACHGLIA